MAVNVTQIEAIRTAALAQLQTLLTSEGPTVTVGEEQVPWTPWLAALETAVDWCDRKLAEYAPYEVHSTSVT